MSTWRFDGEIAGVGTASGTRLVVGMWRRTPFGELVDLMIEDPAGHRTLVAPSRQSAEFIAATYAFDDVRIEPVSLRRSGRELHVSSESVRIALVVGRHTLTGRLLSLVPRPLARSRRWVRLIDPVAARLRTGVHTHGSAGSGRHEYYCALDEHRLVSATVRLDGIDLGALAPVHPPVRFGFASAPRRPAVVRVTTIVDSVGS